MADLLRIDGLKVGGLIQENSEAIVIPVARRFDGRDHCPHCGSLGIAPNGTRRATYRDIPMHGLPVFLDWDKQRFRCKDCGQTCADEHPALLENRHMTRRLAQWIATRSEGGTFAQVAHDAGLDERTVRNVFHDWWAERSQEITFAAPRVLGLDEAHLSHTMRAVFTDIERGSLFDILPDRTSDTIFERAATMPDRGNVEVVCTDMWNSFRTVVPKSFPDATHVIDKWHILAIAFESMEVVRRGVTVHAGSHPNYSILKSLPLVRPMFQMRWFQMSPEQQASISRYLEADNTLRGAYEAKEQFYDIFSLHDEAEARERWKQWQFDLPRRLDKPFKPVLRIMKNWDRQIFAYFRARYTNGLTEGINGLIKNANRNGRGYSFEVLRAKMLLRHGKHTFSAAPPFRSVIERLASSLCALIDRLGSPVERFRQGHCLA